MARTSKADTKAYDALNRERFRPSKRKSKAKRRDGFSKFQAWLKAAPCTDCGGRFPPECMDFDHVTGEKQFQIGHAALRPFIDLVDELLKCELVCSNCHRTRTHNRRTP